VNVDVTMPQLGETVADGTVTRWLRQVGDSVADQEPLVEIATDKVDTEVPSPASGTLLEIRVPADSTVAVGTVIAVIGEPNGSTAPATPAVSVPVPSAAEMSRVEHGSPSVPSSRGRRHRHSPLIRRLARESGLDLVGLVGTGPVGRVTRADVARAATTVERVSPVAAAVTDASPTPPAQPTCVVEVDVSSVVALRNRYADGRADRNEGRLSFAAFLVDAVVPALRAHPLLNASIDTDGRTIRHERQHVGVAVDTDKGVVVSVIKDAADLNLRGLSRRIDDVADRARRGALLPDDVTAGTFTVTDAGARGALLDAPVLVPGQVGILAAGDIVERAVVVHRPDGERAIAIRSMAYLALTYDHRLIDGADAARFLTYVKERLQAERSDSDLR